MVYLVPFLPQQHYMGLLTVSGHGDVASPGGGKLGHNRAIGMDISVSGG